MIDKEDIFRAITKGYTIQNAYENWTGYRSRITDYLIKYTEPHKKTALLGIGEANDIDLRRLYEHTGNLTLVDKNLDGMRTALKKYSLEEANVNLVKKDFVGITEDEYKEIIDIYLSDVRRLGSRFSPMDTAPKIVSKLNEIYARVNSKDINLGIDMHDYVVAIGINSQLNSFIMNLWGLVLTAVRQNETSVEICAAKQNDVFIPRFCKALENCARERVFVGVEDYRIETEGSVQGAEQTIDYFGKYAAPGCLEGKIAIYQDVWPLMEGKTYKMVLFNIKK